MLYMIGMFLPKTLSTLIVRAISATLWQELSPYVHVAGSYSLTRLDW